MSSEKKSSSGNTSFEQDLENLEAIVNALEEGKLPLDEALRRFEAGVGLVRRCEKTLRQAERKIEMLVRGMDGEMETQPFDEDAADGESEKEAGDASPRPTATRKSTPRKAVHEESFPPEEESEESEPQDKDDWDKLF